MRTVVKEREIVGRGGVPPPLFSSVASQAPIPREDRERQRQQQKCMEKEEGSAHPRMYCLVLPHTHALPPCDKRRRESADPWDNNLPRQKRGSDEKCVSGPQEDMSPLSLDLAKNVVSPCFSPFPHRSRESTKGELRQSGTAPKSPPPPSAFFFPIISRGKEPFSLLAFGGVPRSLPPCFPPPYILPERGGCTNRTTRFHIRWEERGKRRSGLSGTQRRRRGRHGRGPFQRLPSRCLLSASLDLAAGRPPKKKATIETHKKDFLHREEGKHTVESNRLHLPKTKNFFLILCLRRRIESGRV